MKKFTFILAAFSAICSSLSLQAQESAVVPMSVVFCEESSNIPASSYDFLTTRLKSAIARNGMGDTENFTQFYLSCSYSVVEKHVVPGAPTKYFQTVEMNFFVADAFARKVFTSTSIESKGVGNSEQQACTAGIRQVSATNSVLSAFIREAGKKIIRYYDEQYRNIIAKAQALAKVYSYEEALFQLSLVPEACAGYQEVLNVATGIYQKYLDDKANKALAKATAIWNAGQDAYAAAEAGVCLAEILPEAGCYPQAVALSNEIRKTVKSDIDYYRKQDEIDRQRAHEENMAEIAAWKAVGVAYGNNQKTNYYYRTLL